ncbi:MAG: 6-bladed beta-propeller [Cytophagia bacterium]|nr:6-bladed beta-propeller [Cytophagia bacterium]
MKVLGSSFQGLLFLFLLSNSIHAQKMERFDRGDFEKTIRLNGELFLSENLNYPLRIKVSSEANGIFVTDSKSDQLVKVFSLKSGEFVVGFVSSGMGPGELQNASDIEVFADNNLVVVNGAIQKRMDFYDLDKVLEGSSPMPTKTLTFRNTSISSPKYLGKDRFLDLNDTNEGNPSARFNLISSKDKIISSHGDFPDSEVTKDLENLRSQVFYAFLGAAADHSNFIVANAYTDILEIYDSKYRLVKRIQGPDSTEPNMKLRNVGNGYMVAPTKETMLTYTAPVVGNDRFFVMYRGQSMSEPGYHSQVIFSFDMSGKPLNIYELDVPVFTFDIDWENNVLYGLTHESPFDDAEVAVIKFDLFN